MRHLNPNAEIHTFSLLIDDPQVSEARWIEAVENQTKTVRHSATPTAPEFSEDLADLIYAQEEPFGGTSMYAEFRIHRLIREAGFKVVLTGDGGDEIFAGYPQVLGAR